MKGRNRLFYWFLRNYKSRNKQQKMGNCIGCSETIKQRQAAKGERKRTGREVKGGEEGGNGKDVGRAPAQLIGIVGEKG